MGSWPIRELTNIRDPEFYTSLQRIASFTTSVLIYLVVVRSFKFYLVDTAKLNSLCVNFLINTKLYVNLAQSAHKELKSIFQVSKKNKDIIRESLNNSLEIK